jgi:UDP-GlcNAc:undecaprenyl-phosphate GlcNAc-1-phosphate transferase
MKPFVLDAAIAFVCSSFLMPATVILSRRLKAVSEVGGRHIGIEPVGRLGGMGVLLGALIGTISTVYYFFPEIVREPEASRKVVGLILSLTIFGVIGFWDDIRRLSAGLKLSFQLVAAVVSYFFGLRVDVIDLPLLEPFSLGWFGLPITIFWIVGVVNAVNLIDGLDGLAGGVILFAAACNFAAAIVSGAVLTSVMMAATAGSILGFLFYNWHPARIYLGDGGAYSFGFLLAVGGFFSPNQKASTSVGLMVPALALGLPIFDTLFTLIRRFLRQQKMFSPDRGHLHHILLDSGISHRRVVIGLYTMCCILCSIAIMVVLNRNKNVGYALIGASVLAIIWWSVLVQTQLKKIYSQIIWSKTKVEAEKSKIR